MVPTQTLTCMHTHSTHIDQACTYAWARSGPTCWFVNPTRENAPNGPLVCSIKQVRIVGSAPIDPLGREVPSIHDFSPAEALPASASYRVGLRPRQLQLAGWGRTSAAHILTVRLGAADGVRERSSSPGEHLALFGSSLHPCCSHWNCVVAYLAVDQCRGVAHRRPPHGKRGRREAAHDALGPWLTTCCSSRPAVPRAWSLPWTSARRWVPPLMPIFDPHDSYSYTKLELDVWRSWSLERNQIFS
jgi:hypothetical protein